MIPVIVGQFVKRQTRTSEFGYFSGTWDELAEKVQSVLDMGIFKSGYREGVILVPLSTKGFFTSIVKYSRDIITETIWEKRQEHEEPVRKSVAYGKKQPAVKVDVVLYRKNCVFRCCSTQHCAISLISLKSHHRSYYVFAYTSYY